MEQKIKGSWWEVVKPIFLLSPNSISSATSQMIELDLAGAEIGTKCVTTRETLRKTLTTIEEPSNQVNFGQNWESAFRILFYFFSGFSSGAVQSSSLSTIIELIFLSVFTINMKTFFEC